MRLVLFAFKGHMSMLLFFAIYHRPFQGWDPRVYYLYLAFTWEPQCRLQLPSVYKSEVNTLVHN